ncbi:MAG: hypothetical protein AB7F65_00050 [Dehalococcoidia bacterium]
MTQKATALEKRLDESLTKYSQSQSALNRDLHAALLNLQLTYRAVDRAFAARAESRLNEARTLGSRGIEAAEAHLARMDAEQVAPDSPAPSRFPDADALRQIREANHETAVLGLQVARGLAERNLEYAAAANAVERSLLELFEQMGALAIEAIDDPQAADALRIVVAAALTGAGLIDPLAFFAAAGAWLLTLDSIVTLFNRTKHEDADRARVEQATSLLRYVATVGDSWLKIMATPPPTT